MKNPKSRFRLNLMYNDSLYGSTVLNRDAIVINDPNGGYMTYYEHRDIVMELEKEIERLKNMK